jgi:hypothetical protein
VAQRPADHLRAFPRQLEQHNTACATHGERAYPVFALPAAEVLAS